MIFEQNSKEFHLKIAKGDVGEYVILTGDPGRVPLIAERFDRAEKIAYNREFCTYSGFLHNVKVSAISTGIGGPSAAIAMEELIHAGAHTFIRVGTSGGMALKVSGGDLVIPTAAIRGDGTGREYLPDDYPAAADFSVTAALANSARELSSDADGKRFHIGVVQSKDSFYGETNPETMPIKRFLTDRWDAYLACGCLTSEMECATLFAVALARGVRAGAVLTAIWNVERARAGLADNYHNDSGRAIECAIGAMKDLILNDRREK